MNKKRIPLFAIVILLVLVFAACGNSKEDEARVREVAQKYFDALRIGDREGEYDCYLPTERQRRDAESRLWGMASQVLLRVDITNVISDLDILFGGESTFAQYKYKASDVKLSEDGTEAVAYVDAYIEKELRGSVRVNMIEYDGNWYVVKGTIADDDRTPSEMAETGENVSRDSAIQKLSGRIWISILAAAFSATALFFLVRFLLARRGRKPSASENPFIHPLGGMEPGDILCSCGMVNPAGIRTCMGCGKKLKRKK